MEVYSRQIMYCTIRLNKQKKGWWIKGIFRFRKKKKEQQRAKQVVNADETIFKENRFDAKEKGRNEYSGDGGKHRKKFKGDGKVVAKSVGGFDIKI